MYKKRQFLAISFGIVYLAFFLGCSPKRFVDVADVINYSQNPINYVSDEEIKVTGKKLFKDEIRKDFDKRYFIPWSLKKTPFSLAQIKWPWESFTFKNSFKENQKAISRSWFKRMLIEANFDEYGKVSKPGIVIRTNSIRHFPTHKPVFKDFAIAGEGYPFDYAQNSLAVANEPLFISHYSRTKEWVYIITSYTSGWLPSHNVAFIEPNIIKKWAKSRQATMLEDDISLYDLDNNFIINSRIGMMMPIMKIEDSFYQCILATSKNDGFVTFSIVKVPRNKSVSQPIPLKAQSIAIMAKELINKAYGWGDLYKNRDSSSTLRDLFKPFSLWLPRNSKEQARIGRIIDLHLLQNRQKEQEIIKNALPFQTLLYIPGHIMLYIGSINGKAIIMHNIWDIQTSNRYKKKRNIVGRTIISTLTVGKELRGFIRKNTLLDKIVSMNIITMEALKVPLVISPKKSVRKKQKSARQKRREAKEKRELENNTTTTNVKSDMPTLDTLKVIK